MKEPQYQYRRELILSIIVVPPVASITALICTFAPRLNLYLDFCRVLIFAKSLNALFQLIVDYFGGVKVSSMVFSGSTSAFISGLGNDAEIEKKAMVIERLSLQSLPLFAEETK